LRPDIPVVMMTAYFSAEIAAQVRDRGASDCLSKPFDFDGLKQTIEREILSRRPRQSAVL
jgi:DNA-binding NtrC family response regulator